MPEVFSWQEHVTVSPDGTLSLKRENFRTEAPKPNQDMSWVMQSYGHGLQDDDADADGISADTMALFASFCAAAPGAPTEGVGNGASDHDVEAAGSSTHMQKRLIRCGYAQCWLLFEWAT